MDKSKSAIVSARVERNPATKTIFSMLAAALFLTGCQTMGGQVFSNFDVFGSPNKFMVGEDVVLPRDRRALDGQSGVASSLRLAVELDQQKRFAEARHLISQVRSIQSTKSDGYQVTTASMAILALKEGNFFAFKRIARQLDASLGNPVRVEAPHTAIITLYRAVSGKALPVNAPENMKTLKDKYPPVRNAQLQRKPKP